MASQISFPEELASDYDIMENNIDFALKLKFEHFCELYLRYKDELTHVKTYYYQKAEQLGDNQILEFLDRN